VDFDLLSDKIKQQYWERQKQEPPVGRSDEPHGPYGYHRKPGKEEIIEILKRHNWNKSRAAGALNMTYHGLHKKMKKMGIKKIS
jgi:transcriptional regulator with GAF, ATPase, and Fis domain